jgi:hypothetical protein
MCEVEPQGCSGAYTTDQRAQKPRHKLAIEEVLGA